MKFLATRELGRLAKWLRILGFDTAYFRDDNKSSLIITALREDRMILTRNKILLKDKALKILFVKSEDLKEQLKQLIKDSNIKINPKDMFTRCILCNKVLSEVAKENVADKIPEYVFQTQEVFCRCGQCGRIYWQGTHWGNVTATLEEITESNQKPVHRNQK